MSDSIVFQQDPGLSPGEVVLEGGLLIVVKRGFGMADRREYSLREINPNLETTSRRFWTLYMGPLFMLLLLSYFGWFLERRGIITLSVLWIWWLLSLILLRQVASGFRMIETLLIRDLNGNVICEIYKPRRAGFRYDEFLNVFTAVRKTG